MALDTLTDKRLNSSFWLPCNLFLRIDARLNKAGYQAALGYCDMYDILRGSTVTRTWQQNQLDGGSIVARNTSIVSLVYVARQNLSWPVQNIEVVLRSEV